MKKKINSKFMLISAIAIIVMAICAMVLFYDILKKQIFDDLKANAHVISMMKPEDLPDEINYNLNKDGLRITLINEDGTVIYDSMEDESKMENHRERPEIASALAAGEGRAMRKSTTSAKHTFYYAMRTDDGKVLRIGKDSNSIYSLIIKMVYLTLSVGFCVFVLCTVLAHRLTKRLVAPIEKMADNIVLLEENDVELSDFQGTEFGTQVLVAQDGLLLGQIVISDTLKSDAVSAIGTLKKQNLHTVMLTGDAQDNAQHVAAETGIDEVRARLLPENKLSELEKVRAQRGSVMFVGDGINDAPVLAGADVGAAMGTGADAAIEAADVVFMNSDMTAIPTAIDIARRTRRISWQNVYFALAVKLIVMVLGLMGYANMWIAVFADTGVSMLCLLNSIRILYHK